MRRRRHILSTRLTSAEVGVYGAALAAPGGGWYVPAEFARWVVLRGGDAQANATRIDVAAVRQALPGFVAAGRLLNSAAYCLNIGANPQALLAELAERWPDSVAPVMAAVVPADGITPCPVPVQIVAPTSIRSAAPEFRQRPRPARRRYPGENPLREVVVATRLDDTELAAVQVSAQRAGLDPADFFRVQLLGCSPLRQRRLPRPAARCLAAVLGEAGRQANNWRQIARAYERRQQPVPSVAGQGLPILWDLRTLVVPTLARWRP